MEYGDEEDERSDFNTAEVDWGEEQEPSPWSEEERYDHNSWKRGTGEAYEFDKKCWNDKTESESAFDERDSNEEAGSRISLEKETDALDEENSEFSFCERVSGHNSLEDQHVCEEESSCNEESFYINTEDESQSMFDDEEEGTDLEHGILLIIK